MDDTSLQAIKDILERNESLGILVGKEADLDSMGAALAFYLSLKQMGKNVSIACPTDPLVELSSLVGIDKVKRNLDAQGGDLVVSFPYEEGAIEKVSYTLENGFLNIVVKAGEKGLLFSENEVKFQRGGNLAKNLFIIGTPRISDLGNLFDPQALKDTTIINIDNKADNQGFGDVVFVSQRFSSVCEQIAELLNFLGFEMDIDIAQNLLSGISFATNNFQHPKTSSFAFETVANLMKKGAVRTRVASRPISEDVSFVAPQQPRSPREAGSQPKARLGAFQTPPQFRGFDTSKNLPDRKPLPFPKPSFPPSFPQSSVKPTQQPSGQVPPKRQEEVNEEEETPADWLTPKIYKGSTNI